MRRILAPVLFCLLAAGVILAAGMNTAEHTGEIPDDDCSTTVSLGDLYASAQSSSTRADFGWESGWSPDKSAGDDDDDDDDDVICICHVPKGNPDDAHTICVGYPAICAHLKHGDKLGPCAATCGGEAGDTCEEGQFCKLPDGECSEDAEGECQDLPMICPPIYAPVCGCDGRTYSSDCYADVAGVAIDHEGPCEEPVVCGGTAGDTCEEGQYCKRPDGECADDAEGVCTDIPLSCPSIYAPVCGCDGMTYDNACLANAAGVTVEHEGECDGQQACGGTAGDTCGENEFCKRPEGACGDEAEGVCEAKPEACPAVIAPVCGCDGTTYDNACLADAAGVTVASQGECDGGEVACGGTAGDTCEEGQFCKAAEGECAEGAEGVCTDLPTGCPSVYAPVCGCDGTTYDNECLADAAGVTVASQGECTAKRRGFRGR